MTRIFVAIAAAVISIAACSKSDPWIDIGTGGPAKRSEIPYRLIDIGGEENLSRTHSDASSLTMDLQSGVARGRWVLIPVESCYAPRVRDSVPSVQCKTPDGSTLILGGGDNIREVLLGLRKDEKLGLVKGKALGVYGGDVPVIWIVDPELKRVQK